MANTASKRTSFIQMLRLRRDVFFMTLRVSAADIVMFFGGFLLAIVEQFVSQDGDLFGVASVIGLVMALIPLVKTIMDQISNRRSYVMHRDPAYHDEIQERLKLSKEYQDNGYAVFYHQIASGKEGFVESEMVNDLLWDNSTALLAKADPEKTYRVCKESCAACDMKGKCLSFTERTQGRSLTLDGLKSCFVIPVEMKPVSINVLHGLVSKYKSKQLFNGRLLRMCNDILPAGPNKPIDVQEARYFDGQCTHELVYEQAPCLGSVSGGFKGEVLMLDESDELLGLWESRCANFLGSTTFVITTDGKIIIGQQAGGTMANAGKYVPSGSGSVDFADYKRMESIYKSKGRITMHDVITSACEREVFEEVGLDPKTTRFFTYMMGYVRLLERGGKPDFFSVSFVNKDWETIKAEYEKAKNDPAKEDDLSATLTACSPVDGSYAEALRRFWEGTDDNGGKRRNVSIQLAMMIDELAHVEAKPEWKAVCENAARAFSA